MTNTPENRHPIDCRSEEYRAAKERDALEESCAIEQADIEERRNLLSNRSRRQFERGRVKRNGGAA